jgi:hypothetical protein
MKPGRIAYNKEKIELNVKQEERNMAAKIIATANSRRSALKKTRYDTLGRGGREENPQQQAHESFSRERWTNSRKKKKRGKFNRAHIHPWLAVFQCPSLRRARFYHNTFLTIHGAVVSFHSVVTIIRRLLFFSFPWSSVNERASVRCRLS